MFLGQAWGFIWTPELAVEPPLMQDRDKMVIIFVRKQITKHVKARPLDHTSIYPWELKEMTSDIYTSYILKIRTVNNIMNSWSIWIWISLWYMSHTNISGTVSKWYSLNIFPIYIYNYLDKSGKIEVFQSSIPWISFLFIYIIIWIGVEK